MQVPADAASQQQGAGDANLNPCHHVAGDKLLKDLLSLVGWIPQQVQQQLNIEHMQCELCMFPLQMQSKLLLTC